MRKIPTYFEHDSKDRSRVIDEVNLACAWVAFGEGIATRKIDGACCMVHGGNLFKRREVRLTDARPDGFERTDLDVMTSKEFGWVPVGDGPGDQWFREGFMASQSGSLPDGTYELVGPKVQGNPEGMSTHMLIAHADGLEFDEQPPRTFEALKRWLTGRDIEGIVWHHRDGRMAKIKLRDFGLRRTPKNDVKDQLTVEL